MVLINPGYLLKEKLSILLFYYMGVISREALVFSPKESYSNSVTSVVNYTAIDPNVPSFLY